MSSGRGQKCPFLPADRLGPEPVAVAGVIGRAVSSLVARTAATDGVGGSGPFPPRSWYFFSEATVLFSISSSSLNLFTYSRSSSHSSALLRSSSFYISFILYLLHTPYSERCINGS